MLKLELGKELSAFATRPLSSLTEHIQNIILQIALYFSLLAAELGYSLTDIVLPSLYAYVHIQRDMIFATWLDVTLKYASSVTRVMIHQKYI